MTFNAITPTNQVLLQAWQDYEPAIVGVADSAINKLNFTPDQKAHSISHEVLALQERDIKEGLRFLIALNSINYQFWDLQNGEFVRYEHNGKVGAIAMFEGFCKLFDFISNTGFNTELINLELIDNFFGKIPKAQERVDILKEALNDKKFNKVFNTINDHISTSNFNTQLAQNIAAILPLSYCDPYLKKIQLALYEISSVYCAHKIEVGCDITVAADYQIPKVLEGLGVLVYSEQLKQKIENQELLIENSKEERALRAATIIACDEISHIHKIPISCLDRVLWLARNEFKDKKFHLTKTSRY